MSKINKPLDEAKRLSVEQYMGNRKSCNVRCNTFEHEGHIETSMTIIQRTTSGELLTMYDHVIKHIQSLLGRKFVFSGVSCFSGYTHEPKQVTLELTFYRRN